MARITSQAAVSMIGNRYEMVLIAARRARELARGDAPKVTKVLRVTKHVQAFTAAGNTWKPWSVCIACGVCAGA
jgi:DNA-directed RNA polymerase omega subunit